MAGFFGDARGELDFEAGHWYRKLVSQISSISTADLLFWGNSYYLESLEDENDCDFQVFIVYFLSNFVRSGSYFPRKSGIITEKVERSLLELFSRYYSPVRKMRDIEMHVGRMTYLPAVIHSADIYSMGGYFKRELAPYRSLVQSAVGCTPEAIVDCFSALASAALDKRRPLKRSSLMVLPDMNIGRAFLGLAAARMAEGPEFRHMESNWTDTRFYLSPLLRLDGNWFCFAPQLVFPHVLKLVRSVVRLAGDEIASQWDEIERAAAKPDMVPSAMSMDVKAEVIGNPASTDSRVASPENHASAMDEPTANRPGSDVSGADGGEGEETGVPDPSEEFAMAVPVSQKELTAVEPDLLRELTEEAPDSPEAQPLETPDFPKERPLEDDIYSDDDYESRTWADDDLDEEPEDYPEDASEEFDEFAGVSDEIQEPDIYSVIDAQEMDLQEKREAEENADVGGDDESIQPSLFKDIVVNDGEETLVDSAVIPEKAGSGTSNIDALNEAVINEIESASEKADADFSEDIGETLFSMACTKAGGSLAASTYLESLGSERKAELKSKLKQACMSYLADGRDKMFSVVDGCMSFCVVALGGDYLKQMELENGIAAVMLVNERTMWNAFIITPSGGGKKLDMKLLVIRKDSFNPRRWKLVQQLGWKLYLQKRKSDKR